MTGKIEVETRKTEVVTGKIEVETRKTEVVTRKTEVVTRKIEVVTRKTEREAKGADIFMDRISGWTGCGRRPCNTVRGV
ncbi:hypothetical protein GVN16_10920 [Emticicia sp. CRIBPO]|uniref:hypothetical protein n=1 Tax=Emticicia sp. CRIBPO TaxID=2683258 RepID=UPI001411F678|nr:hypothetical protein [Emticicia sp. CRIBPO]NBA86277.1 hypothetical protein [Emticicia sp. CRIBPO]